MSKIIKPIIIQDVTITNICADKDIDPVTEKMIALAAKDAGADYVEIGFPGPETRDVARALEGRAAVYAGPLNSHIDCCGKAFFPERDIDHTLINIALDVGRFYTVKQCKTFEDVVKAASGHVERAKGYFRNVQFTIADANVAKPEQLLEVAYAAINAGANTICLAESPLDKSTDTKIYNMFANLKEGLKERGVRSDEYVMACHCHNNGFSAYSKTMEAIHGGATKIDATVNGIGRPEHLSLEEALKIAGEFARVKVTPTMEMAACQASGIVRVICGKPEDKGRVETLYL